MKYYSLMKKAVTLTFALFSSLSLIAVQILGGVFTDTGSYYSAAVLDKWGGLGVIKGYAGLYRPDDYITRAEVGAILEQIMGYVEEAENVYLDLYEEDWYYHAMLKMVAAEVLESEGGMLNPSRPITKEEETGILNKVFRMTGVFDFIDYSDPETFVTRGEVINHINSLIELMAADAGIYSGGIYENLVVRAEAALADMTVNGNVYITNSGGDITLDNVIVGGTLIVSGDVNNLCLSNCRIDSMEVNTLNGAANVLLLGTTSIGIITLESGVNLTAGIQNQPDVAIAESIRPGQVVSLAGAFGHVTNNAAMQAFIAEGTIEALIANEPLEVYGTTVISNIFTAGVPVSVFGSVIIGGINTASNSAMQMVSAYVGLNTTPQTGNIPRTVNTGYISLERQSAGQTTSATGSDGDDETSADRHMDKEDNNNASMTAPYILSISVLGDRLLNVVVSGDVTMATPVISPGLGIVAVTGYDAGTNSYTISTQYPMQPGVTYTLRFIGDSWGEINRTFTIPPGFVDGGAIGPVNEAAEPEIPNVGTTASAVLTVTHGVISDTPVELVFAVTSNVRGTRSANLTATAAEHSTPEAVASALRGLFLDDYNISGSGDSVMATAQSAVQGESLTLSLTDAVGGGEVWGEAQVAAEGGNSSDVKASAFVDIIGTAARNAEIIVTIISSDPGRNDTAIVTVTKGFSAMEIASAIGSADYAGYNVTASGNRVIFSAKDSLNGETITSIDISEQSGLGLGFEINVEAGETGLAGIIAIPASASVEVGGAAADGTVMLIIDSNLNGRVVGEFLVGKGDDGGQVATRLASAVVPGYSLTADGAHVRVTAAAYAAGESLTLSVEDAATGASGKNGDFEPGQSSSGNPGSETWVIFGDVLQTGAMTVTFSYMDNEIPAQATTTIHVNEGWSALKTAAEISKGLNAAFAGLGLSTELIAESNDENVIFSASAERCPITLNISDYIGEITCVGRSVVTGVAEENGVIWTVSDGMLAAGEIKLTISDGGNVLAECNGIIENGTAKGVYDTILAMKPEGFIVKALMESDEVIGISITPETAGKSIDVTVSYDTGITAAESVGVKVSQAWVTIAIPDNGPGSGSLRVTAAVGSFAKTVVLEFTEFETSQSTVDIVCTKICDILTAILPKDDCEIKYVGNGVITLVSLSGEAVAINAEKADVHMDVLMTEEALVPFYYISEQVCLLTPDCPEVGCENNMAHGSGGLAYEIWVNDDSGQPSVSGTFFVDESHNKVPFEELIAFLIMDMQETINNSRLVGIKAETYGSSNDKAIIYLDLIETAYRPEDIVFNIYPLSLDVDVDASSKQSWVWQGAERFHGGAVTVELTADGVRYEVCTAARSGSELLEAVAGAVSGLSINGVNAKVLDGEITINWDSNLCDVTAFSVTDAVIGEVTGSSGKTETTAWSDFELNAVSDGYIYMTVTGDMSRPPEIYGFILENGESAAGKAAAQFGDGSAYIAECRDDGEILVLTAKTAVNGETIDLSFAGAHTDITAELAESIPGTAQTVKEGRAEWIITSGVQKPGTVLLSITDNINGDVSTEINVNPEEQGTPDDLAARLVMAGIKGYILTTGTTESGETFVRVMAEEAIDGQSLGVTVTDVPAGILFGNAASSDGVPAVSEICASVSLEFTGAAVSDGWIDIMVSDGTTEETRSVAVDEGIGAVELSARVAAAFSGGEYKVNANSDVVTFTAETAKTGEVLAVETKERRLEVGFDAMTNPGDTGKEGSSQQAASTLTIKGQTTGVRRITLVIQSSLGDQAAVIADVKTGATAVEIAAVLAAAADASGFSVTSLNDTVTVTALKASDGEVLTLFISCGATASGVTTKTGSQVSGVAATVGKPGIWTVEIMKPLTAGDVLEINGNLYLWDSGFGESAADQAAMLSKLIDGDMPRFTVTSRGPVIIFTQKQPGAGGKPSVRLKS